MLTALLLACSVWAFDQDHATWTAELKKYVVISNHASKVNYKAWKTQRQELDKYTLALSTVSEREFATFSENQQKAFLINAYNALTVKLILDNYPVKSIKKIGGLFTSPWKLDFFELLGAKHTLDWIEHEVLRKKYKDPFVHFAVNCASIGCPALRAEAFLADRLPDQLKEQALLFLTDKTRNRIDEKSKVLYVSKIFSWFAEDFKAMGVPGFVGPFMTHDADLQQKLKSYSLSYSDYDWNLNEQK